MGGHVRVGLEDSIYYNYPKKELATNARLVKRIVNIAKELSRDIASPKETREILGL
jgi:3-keto-5-aminohexanoate cleavage enzyme